MYAGLNGGGFDPLNRSARISCYGCFLPDLTGFTTYRHGSSEPSPPFSISGKQFAIPLLFHYREYNQFRIVLADELLEVSEYSVSAIRCNSVPAILNAGEFFDCSILFGLHSKFA